MLGRSSPRRWTGEKNITSMKYKTNILSDIRTTTSPRITRFHVTRFPPRKSEQVSSDPYFNGKPKLLFYDYSWHFFFLQSIAEGNCELLNQTCVFPSNVIPRQYQQRYEKNFYNSYWSLYDIQQNYNIAPIFIPLRWSSWKVLTCRIILVSLYV